MSGVPPLIRSRRETGGARPQDRACSTPSTQHKAIHKTHTRLTYLPYLLARRAAAHLLLCLTDRSYNLSHTRNVVTVAAAEEEAEDHPVV